MLPKTVLVVIGFAHAIAAAVAHPVCSDPNATGRTRALVRNLSSLASDHVLFGHQDTLAYGMGWRGGDFDSDVDRTCGKFPAVFGWDLGHIGEANNLDGVPFVEMKRWIRQAYGRGGVITISWHARVPGTDRNAWTEQPVVEHILPGGDRHQAFVAMLDAVADFLGDLEDDQGEAIPVIFRPWHENHGSWFWWGADHCTPDQYRQLWRLTVEYLRQTRGLHHLLTAYSPNNIYDPEDFYERYPGDDVVDVFGFDEYVGLTDPNTRPDVLRMAEMISKAAQEHRKLFAFTETGYETIPDPNWWTGVLLPFIKTNPATRQMAWVLVWRNGRPDHYYAPYPGQVSAEDFKAFAKDPLTLFLEDLPGLYE